MLHLFACVIHDWETDLCTRMEFLIEDLPQLPGEAGVQHSLDWLQEKMQFISVILVQRTHRNTLK